MGFSVVSKYAPKGDQPQAIASLAGGISRGEKFQTLLGVTGSGKTFTVANVIEKVQKPTLVLAHNKTLAAQLFSEFKDFFPHNAVEYFVSYYDYYQPESYIPGSDTYIEKDAQVNDEIDKLRHSATSALSERKDVIIVASVSCIYGLGDPIDYNSMVLSLRPGMVRSRDDIIRKLVEIRYERGDIELSRNKFRARGDTVEIFPVYSSGEAVRIEMFGDEIERIVDINPVTGEALRERKHVAVYPASHYVSTPDKMKRAIETIKAELSLRLIELEMDGKLVEAQRLRERTNYDLEMMEEIGFCNGIENYSRHISGREPGSPPFTLIDYFPDDFLLVIDESHVTLPQVRAMYAGDQARKKNLVDYGFRLPSAKDNRPLEFKEFYEKINQAIFISATPGDYERAVSSQIVEQIIRPTGLVDPEIEVRPITGQIEDLTREINVRAQKSERVLVTTLTKKMAEQLTEYFEEHNVRVKYLHSEVQTLDRIEIIRGLRLGEFDVLIGINLLREGLDIPEVSLVAILDADKEGFLRSQTSLIQTIGRAARNADSRVIMYADSITKAMDGAISETNRRRKIQIDYNEKNGITPKTIIKPIRELIEATSVITAESGNIANGDIARKIAELSADMKKAAELMQFELAARLRDEIKKLTKKLQT